MGVLCEKQKKLKIWCSVSNGVDPRHFRGDPDSGHAFHFDTDQDQVKKLTCLLVWENLI
jgi:hypothetical protein